MSSCSSWIKRSTLDLGFNNYKEHMDFSPVRGRQPHYATIALPPPCGDEWEHAVAPSHHRRFLPFNDTDAYRL